MSSFDGIRRALCLTASFLQNGNVGQGLTTPVTDPAGPASQQPFTVSAGPNATNLDRAKDAAIAGGRQIASKLPGGSIAGSAWFHRGLTTAAAFDDRLEPGDHPLALSAAPSRRGCGATPRAGGRTHRRLPPACVASPRARRASGPKLYVVESTEANGHRRGVVTLTP